MSQSRRHSALESIVNVAIGYGVALLGQILVFPLFGLHVPISSDLGIGAIFTGISLVRGFCVRRLFNSWHARGAA